MEAAAAQKKLGRKAGGQRESGGLSALYRKELADHIRSKRFLIILALIAITGIASLYGALGGIQTALEEQGSDFVFLRLFTTTNQSIPSFVSFIALLGPLVGLTLGFDAINSERSRGTMGRLVSQPIYRDAVITGKFLSGLTIIFVMVFSLGLIISGIGLIAIGIPPTGEEMGRLLLFLFFTGVYMALWLGLSILFSILCRHAATSALAVIALWLFFAIFIGLFAGMIVDAVFPVSETATQDVMLQNYTWNQNINHLSPTNIYGESVSILLNPNIRIIGLVTQEQLSGAVVGVLPLGQSLLLVWPHLTALAAMMLLSFIIAYVCFMRQEIRAG